MDTLKTVLNRIAADCTQWNTQYTHYHPQEITRRRDAALKPQEVVRALLGLFLYPRFFGADTIYLFEGLRHKEYMTTFDRRLVFLVGSHRERAFAKECGYGFIWSFPIDAAVRAKIYRGLSLLAYVQMLFWRSALGARKNVVFFLYEDTQPLGTFFVHLARELLKNARTVCIQHGYFSSLKHPLRYEGELSEINFVWDDRQTRLMGLNPDKTFPIGLPYFAKGRAESKLSVVLVGDGAPYGDPYSYKSALEAFHEISKIAEEELGLTVVYRPHPNESVHAEVVERLKQRFKSIDGMGKVERLNAGRSIYVGTVSSLLYEAKQAGHFVVCIKIQDKEKPIFDTDLTLRSEELKSFAAWARSLMQQTPSDAQSEDPKPGEINAHLIRFREAVAGAKLPLC